MVAEAGDVSEALRRVSVHHPTVLILDLNMPGGSSLTAIPGIKESAPSSAMPAVMA